MADALSELESALGHSFAKRELLVRALTHRSFVNALAASDAGADERRSKEQAKAGLKEAGAGPKEETAEEGDNERLEFLGDAVLGLVVAEALFAAHPEWHEGELTRVRAQLVSRQHLAEVAQAIDLGVHLRLSRGEERSGLRRKSTVLSNTMEAVVAAVYLDGGLEPARAFARRRVMGEAVEKLAEELLSGAALGNFKSALQEHLQASGAGTPEYRLKSESGPDHRKRFGVEVRLKTNDGSPGKALARGMGNTKKDAEQDAARRALERLSAAAAKADGRTEDGGRTLEREAKTPESNRETLERTRDEEEEAAQ